MISSVATENSPNAAPSLRQATQVNQPAATKSNSWITFHDAH